MQAAERERLIRSLSSGALSAGPWPLFGCACGLGVLVLVVARFPGRVRLLPNPERGSPVRTTHRRMRRPPALTYIEK